MNSQFNSESNWGQGGQKPSMTEKELLNDLLNQEKQMIDNYTYSIIESSCPNLRQVLHNQFNQTCQDQFSVFKNMQQKGWYKTKDAPDADVNQAKQDVQQLQTELV